MNIEGKLITAQDNTEMSYDKVGHFDNDLFINDDAVSVECYDGVNNYSYEKEIGGLIYCFDVLRDKDNPELVSIHFSVKNNNPLLEEAITNKGLVIADKIFNTLIAFTKYVYEKEKFSFIEISASKKKWLATDLENIKNNFFKLIEQNKNVLDGFNLEYSAGKLKIDNGKIVLESNDGQKYICDLENYFEEQDFDSTNPDNLLETLNRILMFLEDKGISYEGNNKIKDAEQQRLKMYLRKLKRVLPNAEIINNKSNVFIIKLPDNFDFNNLPMFQKNIS